MKCMSQNPHTRRRSSTRGAAKNSTAGLGQPIFVTETKRLHPLGALACIQVARLIHSDASLNVSQALSQFRALGAASASLARSGGLTANNS